MSIPTMFVEVGVRLGYFLKRKSEGFSTKESIPFSKNGEKHPKLATMLFIGHCGATAVNAGKVYFTGNPMAINYPQWIAFMMHIIRGTGSMSRMESIFSLMRPESGRMITAPVRSRILRR